MKGSQFEPLVGRVSTRGKKVGLLFGSYQIGEKAEFVNPAFNFETGSKSAFGTSPVTDGDQEVFGRGREELKIGDIQLLHLNGLAEFNDEPEREKKKQTSFICVETTAASCKNTYQILLLQGFSMYRSIFSFNMAAVLWK